MKICVFSDSHGCADNMIRAVWREKPDCCFFLGDGERDLDELRRRFPDLGIIALRGNCDRFSSLPGRFCRRIEGVRVFAVHGDAYEVDRDPQLRALRYAAMAEDADVVLFGHTHVPYRDRSLSMEILNPGTIGAVPQPGYGLLILEGGSARTELLAL